jgi:hypothetical protein
VFVIFSTFFENIFVTKFAWKYWLHIPAFAASILLITFIVWLPIGLILGPINWEAVLIDSIDNSIWGSIYWCIFIFSGFLFKRFVQSSSKIDSG